MHNCNLHYFACWHCLTFEITHPPRPLKGGADMAEEQTPKVLVYKGLWGWSLGLGFGLACFGNG